MDFSQTIDKQRDFKFSEMTGNPEDTGHITIVYAFSSPEYVNARTKIFNENAEMTPEEKRELSAKLEKKVLSAEDQEKFLSEKRQELLKPIMAKHLIKGWKGLTHKNKPVKFTEKSVNALSKTDYFMGILTLFSHTADKFLRDIDLDVDFEEVEKN